MIDKLLEKYKQIPQERFFEDVFKGNEYIDALGRKSDIVLDIGACAGEFSAYIYPKATKIYAIEPFSEYYKELTDNIKEFNLDKIIPFKLAIGDYNGVGKLASDRSRGGNKLEDNPDLFEEVIVKTLAQFIKDEHIERVDVLKIDIEGLEKKVFNSPDFIEVVDRIDYIIGEHLGEVIELLKSYGFSQSADGVNYIFKKNG